MHWVLDDERMKDFTTFPIFVSSITKTFPIQPVEPVTISIVLKKELNRLIKII